MGLLKGIDPILTADLLWVLRAMGHGDRLAVVDCNFPATQVAKSTVTGKDPIILTVPLPQAVSAICELLPLDYFEESAAFYMAPQDGVDMPPEGVEVINELGRAIAISSSPDVSVSPVERFPFYEEAKKCFAIVQTLERRPYGNVILVKGVIGPDGEDLKPN
jgi:L-fucose mutarotase